MIGLYFDEHMKRAVAEALVKRGIQVVMAVDVNMEGKDDDSEHLPYATAHNLVMVTFDHPFARRSMERTDHKGLVSLPYNLRKDTGKTIEVLAEFVELYDAERDVGQVFWLS